jgi:site-specific recombinase XerD
MADFEYVSQVDATQVTGPRPPLDLSYHFSRITQARKESSIKKFYKYFMMPGIGNLAGGKSNSTSPWRRDTRRPKYPRASAGRQH